MIEAIAFLPVAVCIVTTLVRGRAFNRARLHHFSRSFVQRLVARIDGMGKGGGMAHGCCSTDTAEIFMYRVTICLAMRYAVR